MYLGTLAWRGACCAFLLALSGCGHQAADTLPGRDRVSVMTFNVENLFDTRDDPGKNDETYLPLAAKQTEAHRAGCASIPVERWRDQCLNWDWSEAILEKKLAVVARAILQADGGRGPDLVVLQEVENVSVLERLRREHLGPAGYEPAILLEGRDLRGIDVAFLSRLPLASPPVLHDIEFTGVDQQRIDDTRGVLEATFRLPDGALLTALAVHFPAPFHPREMREQAYRHLNQLKAGLPPDRHVVAAGDFNTTAQEDAEHAMLQRLVYPHWQVAHELGCRGCRGTHYYAPNDSWSFLDMLLYSAPSDGRWRLDPASVRLENRTREQVTSDDTPARFSLPDARGVSDHWPLAMTLRRER